MGLSGPRKRSKFSYDPNNTNWSRSESKYGQRILQSQGWRPGDYLGAKDAPHAKHHTVANASHVKVALREDNLGLGARVGAAGGEWETTGLGGFQDLLGRLNGKSEQELEKVQKSRATLKRNLYAERRWGTLQFVSGGLLVGEEMKKVKKEEANEDSLLGKALQASDSTAQSTLHQEAQSDDDTKTKSKRDLNRYNLQGFPNAPLDDSGLLPATTVADSSSSNQMPMNLATDKAQRRAEKAERKLKRKLRREDRLARKNLALVQNPDDTVGAPASPITHEVPREGVALGHTSNGIYAVRQRNIRHKKMAMMDSKALNEILMIKA